MTESFEVGQRVYVSASAMERLLHREPAEGELYRTVRTLHPEHPERWIMLDWPFFWFQVEDVTVLHDNPPRPKSLPVVHINRDILVMTMDESTTYCGKRIGWRECDGKDTFVDQKYADQASCPVCIERYRADPYKVDVEPK
jgi:hypothetical protein